jgi:hypothetical protein
VARRAVLGSLCWAAGSALTLAAGSAAEAGELAASQAQLNVLRRRGEVPPAASLGRTLSAEPAVGALYAALGACAASAAALTPIAVWTRMQGDVAAASPVLLTVAARGRTPGALPWACMAVWRRQWEDRLCVLSMGPAGGA